FFFTPTSAPETYTLSLHDALPISVPSQGYQFGRGREGEGGLGGWPGWREASGVDREPQDHRLPVAHEDVTGAGGHRPPGVERERSEEHTSELQSRGHLVCRLLLEK